MVSNLKKWVEEVHLNPARKGGECLRCEGEEKTMNRRRLMAVKCSLEAEGVCVYLDEYETREEAEEALHNAVIEHADYAIIEEVVAGKKK